MIFARLFWNRSGSRDTNDCSVPQNSVVEGTVNNEVSLNWFHTNRNAALELDDHRALFTHVNAIKSISQSVSISTTIDPMESLVVCEGDT